MSCAPSGHVLITSVILCLLQLCSLAVGQTASGCNPPCQNNGRCYLSPSTNQYSCICDGTGFAGAYCAVPAPGTSSASTTTANTSAQPPALTTTASSSAPPPASALQCNPGCQNRGVCYQAPSTNQLTCICDGTGFAGPYCSIPVPGATGTTTQAASSPPGSALSSATPPTSLADATCNPVCQHGVCYQNPASGVFSCICDGTGYSGAYCSVPIATGNAAVTTAQPSVNTSGSVVGSSPSLSALPETPKHGHHPDMGLIVGVAIGAAVGAALLTVAAVLSYQHIRRRKREGSTFTLARMQSSFERFEDEPGKEVTLTPTSSGAILKPSSSTSAV